MDEFERIYALHGELQARRGPVPADILIDRLGCSRATFFRTVAHLRDGLLAPIVTVKGRGYAYDRNEPTFELPGVWFSADELAALLAMDHLLERLEPGLLQQPLAPVRERIRELLDRATGGGGQAFPFDRIRILATHARRPGSRGLGAVTRALVERRQLRAHYAGRARGDAAVRTLSPQRLVHYRDNWYLDAWCHAAGALRTFAVDRIRAAEVLDQSAREVEPDEIDRQVTGSYGIFAGRARHRARLLFTPERARWVADEVWHPEQSGQYRTDGSYELTVPYGDPRELIGEILRHGAQVRVLGPTGLATAVAEEVGRTLRQYARGPSE